ncbi:MAG: serine/threonine protein phosphatase PrpC [Paracoccaceae bacterium]|jgi:serine/threonine protein phosphatase PrpC
MSFTGAAAPATRHPLTPVAAGCTDQGPARDHNEDAFVLNDPAGIFAVADGMGGHSKGDFASGALKDTLEQAQPLGDARAQLQDMVTRVEAANTLMRAEAAASGASAIGSTLVALLVSGPHGLFGWIGDSRAYLMRDGQMHQTSRDHSVVQALVDRGQLAAEDMESHPHAHVLTRAVGAADKAEFEYAQTELFRGDRVLLCSDGLTRTLTDAQIAEIMRRDATPEAISSALVQAALAAIAQDNVTAVVVEMT